MKTRTFFLLGCIGAFALFFAGISRAESLEDLQRRFAELPPESRRLTGPLFWMHGDESVAQLEGELQKVAEGGNGCFTAESRPHSDWLGEGWYRDLAICLEAAKKHNLKMWIFDEKWWPSQGVAGQVPPRYAAKQLQASAVEVTGPRLFEADGYTGADYIAAVAGRMAVDGTIDGDSLVDMAGFVRDGKLVWTAPEGRWSIMKFTHRPAPGLGQGGGQQLSADGMSRDGVEWFLQTVYQPHFDRFKEDFGKTIAGFFYDEPETQGDWGTELNGVLDEWGVDWKRAYVAYKFSLSGEAQTAATYQYLEARAETWGRTMYGGITRWCEQHGVQSVGHFMEQGGLYRRKDFCAGNVMRLQKYSSMGGIDAVFSQFKPGQRAAYDAPCWQTPKLGSSITHAYGKPDDVTMVEIFGARGQDLPYPEMKWWADHMQVSGVNFLIPHSFNPRAPYDTDCPPYFYNGGYEPRWPLYRVFADYTSRLSILLSGGRHVCPVALLFAGSSEHVGKAITPEQMSESLQDALYDCDWLPYEVFETDTAISGAALRLRNESYHVLIVPPVEVIPYAALAKVREFFDAGGVVIGYGFLPAKSATLGHTSADVTRLRDAIWGTPEPGLTPCKTSAGGGRSYLLTEKPTPEELQQVLARTANIRPTLEVIEGQTSHWLHVLHRVKEGRDVFFVCNQNIDGGPRTFRFRITAQGFPECWDPMRNEVTGLPFERHGDNVELSLTLEPSESVLLVFAETRRPLPRRIEAGGIPPSLTLEVARSNAATTAPKNEPPAPKNGMLTLSPVEKADPFEGHFERPAVSEPGKVRYVLQLGAMKPELAAKVTVNGMAAGGCIGEPLRKDITEFVKPGDNTLRIEPFCPETVQIKVYPY